MRVFRQVAPACDGLHVCPPQIWYSSVHCPGRDNRPNYWPRAKRISDVKTYAERGRLKHFRSTVFLRNLPSIFDHPIAFEASRVSK